MIRIYSNDIIVQPSGRAAGKDRESEFGKRIPKNDDSKLCTEAIVKPQEQAMPAN
jgi:hypothetical protein